MRERSDTSALLNLFLLSLTAEVHLLNILEHCLWHSFPLLMQAAFSHNSYFKRDVNRSLLVTFHCLGYVATSTLYHWNVLQRTSCPKRQQYDQKKQNNVVCHQREFVLQKMLLHAPCTLRTSLFFLFKISDFFFFFFLG